MILLLSGPLCHFVVNLWACLQCTVCYMLRVAKVTINVIPCICLSRSGPVLTPQGQTTFPPVWSSSWDRRPENQQSTMKCDKLRKATHSNTISMLTSFGCSLTTSSFRLHLPPKMSPGASVNWIRTSAFRSFKAIKKPTQLEGITCTMWNGHAPETAPCTST